jgi:adenylate cyclase class 2
MVMPYTETEIKIYVADLAAVEARLRAAGGLLETARVYERNVRYEDAGQTLTPAGRVLRLRQDNRIRLTYKEPTTLDGGMTRTEIEVTVSDFEAMELLLGKLGFAPAWLYEKYRTTYRFGGCEVVLDELPMGHFVEVEGEPAAIHETLARLDLTEAPHFVESYSELFFRLKARLALPFRDLTFANFQGVVVPPDVFGA